MKYFKWHDYHAVVYGLTIFLKYSLKSFSEGRMASAATMLPCLSMVKKYGHLFPGKPAPNLTFTDKNGKQLSLQSFKGQVLLVDIWGTWCAPCIAEMPYLAALQKEYG